MFAKQLLPARDICRLRSILLKFQVTLDQLLIGRSDLPYTLLAAAFLSTASHSVAEFAAPPVTNRLEELRRTRAARAKLPSRPSLKLAASQPHRAMNTIDLHPATAITIARTIRDRETPRVVRAPRSALPTLWLARAARSRTAHAPLPLSPATGQTTAGPGFAATAWHCRRPTKILPSDRQ